MTVNSISSYAQPCLWKPPSKEYYALISRWQEMFPLTGFCSHGNTVAGGIDCGEAAFKLSIFGGYNRDAVPVKYFFNADYELLEKIAKDENLIQKYENMMIDFMSRLDRAFAAADAKGMGADISGPGLFRYFSIQENFDGSVQANLHIWGPEPLEIISGGSFSAAFKKLNKIINAEPQENKVRFRFDTFEMHEPRRRKTIFDFINVGKNGFL
jgi:hypothetical protein